MATHHSAETTAILLKVTHLKTDMGVVCKTKYVFMKHALVDKESDKKSIGRCIYSASPGDLWLNDAPEACLM